MDILFTGATGVIGRLAVPMLLAAGHNVTGLYRSEEDATWLWDEGARPLHIDLFDPKAVDAAVSDATAIVHLATSIPPLFQMKKRSAWDTNDRLRRDATRYLVDAALRHSTQIFVQESITFVYGDGGDAWIDETSPIDIPWDVTASALDAEAQTARIADTGRAGVALRMGSLYGPGSASHEYVAAVARGKIPIIGGGTNYISSLATVDAARAVVSALEAPSGVYNVVDDQPALAKDSLEALVAALGAKDPQQIPRWLARVAIGSAATLMTRSQRVSNRRFKQATGWQPTPGSIVDGWQTITANEAAA